MKHISKILVVLFAVALVFGAVAPRAQAATETGNLVEVAIELNSSGPYEGQFDILIAAVLAADPAVLNALTARSPLTVFAPTDTAFENLLVELGITADDLLGDQALLTQVLLYHVANGNLDSGTVLSLNRIKMKSGGFLIQNAGVLTDANGRTSNIIATDVVASNGVIHAIDTVVLP